MSSLSLPALVPLLGALARSLLGPSCPLQVDRVRPNGMFEFRITLHNPSESPVQLTAVQVRYTTLRGPHYDREQREVVSPFRAQRVVILPHQWVTLTTLPTMDAIADEPATASASCSLARTGDEGRVGK